MGDLRRLCSRGLQGPLTFRGNSIVSRPVIANILAKLVLELLLNAEVVIK